MCFNNFKFVGDGALDVPLVEFKCSFTGGASTSPTTVFVVNRTAKPHLSKFNDKIKPSNFDLVGGDKG